MEERIKDWLYLPNEDSLPAATAFWIAVGILAFGGILLSSVWVQRFAVVIGLGAAVFLLPATIFLVRPDLIRKFYRYYNLFFTGVVVKLSQRWVCAAVFFILILIGGRCAHRIDRISAAGNGTTWESYEASPTGNLNANGLGEVDEDSRGFRNELRRCGKHWVPGLSLFMRLLLILDVREARASVPTDTYTLY